MPFFPREEKDIISDSLQRMNQSTNITQMSPGGKARFFIATVSKEQAKLNQQFNENLLLSYIRYSHGKYLGTKKGLFQGPQLTESSATHPDFLSSVRP